MQHAPTVTPTALHHLIEQQALHDPAATALWWQGQASSYGAFWLAIQSLAGRLAQAGRAGERVAVLAWNCPELMELIYAVPAAGQLLVPLNARLAPAELVEQLQRSGASTLLGDATLLEPVVAAGNFPAGINVIAFGEPFEKWRQGPMAPLPQINSEDPAWLLFTSGSTGKPKGALLTHRSFLAGLESAALGRPVASTDRYYYPFPLFHVAAHNVMLQHRYGAAVVLAKSFDATETLQACRDIGVTTLSLAPTMIALLLDHPQFDPDALSGVRTIGYGASAMPISLLRKLQSLSDVGLCQSYGMTELSGSVAFLTVADHRRAAAGQEALLSSVGKPLPTARIAVVDEQGKPCASGVAGEITVMAAQVMQGYWQDRAATGEALVDGWLHTGDIGRFDEQGYLYIVDRKKDMIISGGENVASREVEEALRQNPAIRDCAVIGLPDERWGECVAAVVVADPTVTDEALSAHCRERLAGYKSPRLWYRTDALPLNASGKVDKPLLRRRHGKSD